MDLWQISNSKSLVLAYCITNFNQLFFADIIGANACLKQMVSGIDNQRKGKSEANNLLNRR